MVSILVPVILTLAFFVEAVFGFGGGLIAIPLLSLFLPPADAVIMMLVFQTLKGVLIFGCWRLLGWSVMSLLPVGLLVGVLLGTFLLGVVPPNLLRVLLATYLLLFVWRDLRGLGWMPALTVRVRSVVAGFLGGVVQGLIGTGGPALVPYFRSLGLAKDSFRAHVIAALFLANLPRFFLELNVMLSNDALHASIFWAMPGFILAMALGPHLPRLISEPAFRAVVHLLLVVAALALYAKAFLG